MWRRYVNIDENIFNWLYYSAYGNAQQDDLWQALQEQADEEGVALPTTVKEIMDTWTFKMGFPVITVMRYYGTGGAYVNQVKNTTVGPFGYKIFSKHLFLQERFLLRKTNASANDPTIYKWWVPLTYTHAGLDTSQKISNKWMSKDDSGLALNNLGAAADQWVIFNYDQHSQLLLHAFAHYSI